ncbi:MAG TPA: DUF2283 domain-containing protein [Chloroflexota bacterium]|jgi:hypothetical protein
MADSSALDMTALAKEHHEWLLSILAANDDLAERIEALGVSMDYDEEDDALFVNFGPLVEALTESVNGVVYVRVDPDTLKIYGVEVWGVRALVAEAAAGVRLWWHATEAFTAGLWNRLSRMPASVDTPLPPAEQTSLPVASERLADDIRELVGV